MDNIEQFPSGYCPTNEDLGKYLHDVGNAIVDMPPARNVYIVIESEEGELKTFIAGKQTDIARAVGIFAITSLSLAKD